jgi:hypothetical protein
MSYRRFGPGVSCCEYLTRFCPIGKFLLEINGTPVRTIEDFTGCFQFHLECTHGLESLTLLLVTMGAGKNGPDGVQLGPQDHGQLRSIFHIDHDSALPSSRIGPPPAASYVIDHLRPWRVIPPDRSGSLLSHHDAPFLARLCRSEGVV